MGTRINVSKPDKDDRTPHCHCGNRLPCHKHTGVDGDIDSTHSTPDEFKGNKGNRDN